MSKTNNIKIRKFDLITNDATLHQRPPDSKYTFQSLLPYIKVISLYTIPFSTIAFVINLITRNSFIYIKTELHFLFMLLHPCIHNRCIITSNIGFKDYLIQYTGVSICICSLFLITIYLISLFILFYNCLCLNYVYRIFSNVTYVSEGIEIKIDAFHIFLNTVVK